MMPSAVRRMVGGMAKTIVAKQAETAPSPKNGIAGIRYTKLGMVCIMSSSGPTTRQKRLLSAAEMPIGTPISSAKMVETSTSTSDCTVAFQSPRFHRKAKPTAEKKAMRHVVSRHTPRPIRMMTSHGGRSTRKSVVDFDAGADHGADGAGDAGEMLGRPIEGEVAPFGERDLRDFERHLAPSY